MMEQHIAPILSDQLRTTWLAWLAILTLVFSFTISACASAGESSSKSYDFACIWLMLLTVGYSALTTLMLRKVEMRSPLNLGFLIGGSFMLSMQMLVLAVLSVGNMAKFGGAAGNAPPAEKAVSAFSILLFFAFAGFTAILILFRNSLLPADPMSNQDIAPPAGPGFHFSGVGPEDGMVKNVDTL